MASAESDIPSSMSSQPQAPYSLAILDDYKSIAPNHFSHLTHLCKISSFRSTLDSHKPSDLEELIRRLEPYDIISTMRERTAFPATLLRRLPNLKLLMTTGMRNAAIDMTCAREQGVIVTGTTGSVPPHPEAFAAAYDNDLPPPSDYQSTNQHAWSLLLALCSRIPRDDRQMRADTHAWQSGLAVPLGGKTLGLLGFGRLGALMARTAVLGFGMKIVAWSENLTQEKADVASERLGLPRETCRCLGSKEELFRTADVLSVHYVLSDRSVGIVGEKELAVMKPTALLINTSRGRLIDEHALLSALQRGLIRGAALDVFWEEPLPPDSPWRRSESWPSEVVLSPHMGYVNGGTMHRWYEEQAEIAEQWMAGKPILQRIN